VSEAAGAVPPASEQEDTAPPEWPPPGEVVHRATGRVLPVDPDGRVLLLHGWVPERPDEPFWFTVGGAAEYGESLRDAAARELHEEAGFTASPESLGEPIGESTIEFTWAERLIVQQQTFYAVAVAHAEVSFAGLDVWERDTIDKHGWFTAEELIATGEAGHPDIPELIRAATARVHESR
jgi:8-oxo-dGTP pyrophosphatase MutT (NUDIX family)